MASLAEQLIVETKAAIFARGLSLATSLGLTVTSWAAGDPTRSYFHFIAEVLSRLEPNVAGYVSSGFLDYAEGVWLTLLAKQVFNVDRTEATYASGTVTLTNASGAIYVFEAGDVTVQDSSTGKTFRSTSGGTLAASDGITATTLVLDFPADEAGSDSSSGATDIDTMVTTFLGVTCSNAAAFVGVDEEDDAALRDRCRGTDLPSRRVPPRGAPNRALAHRATPPPRAR